MFRNWLVKMGWVALAAGALLFAGGPALAQHHGGGHGGAHVGGGSHGVAHFGGAHYGGAHVGGSVAHYGGAHWGGAHYGGAHWAGVGHSYGLHSYHPGYYHHSAGYRPGRYRGYGYYPGLYGYGLGLGFYPSYYGSFYPELNGYGYPSYYENNYYYNYYPGDYTSYPEDYVAVPATSAYESLYPPLVAEPSTPVPPVPNNVALVTVNVPATAMVWIDGTLMPGIGSRRLYETPVLTPGVPYAYNIRATWMEDGHEVTCTQHVKFHTGDVVTVDFLSPPASP